MKRKAFLFLVASVMGALLSFAVCPTMVKWMEMKRGMWAIHWADVEKPITRNKIYKVLNLDGFTSGELADCYEEAARALATLSPEVASYRWSDNVLFYPRVSTLLRFPNGGHIEVVASHNNDNSAVSIHFSDRPFTGEGRTEMERIKDFVVTENLFDPSLAAGRGEKPMPARR